LQIKRKLKTMNRKCNKNKECKKMIIIKNKNEDSTEDRKLRKKRKTKRVVSSKNNEKCNIK